MPRLLNENHEYSVELFQNYPLTMTLLLWPCVKAIKSPFHLAKSLTSFLLSIINSKSYDLSLNFLQQNANCGF